MPRRKVNFVPGEVYHVYNRGVNRQTIFFNDGNYAHFLARLRKYVQPCANIISYCLMPNHYHLLVRLTDARFSQAMHDCGMSYAKSLNKQRGRVGSLFQGPFRAIHVDRPEYLMHLSRYIHWNPVAASLVERPEEWPYSSYRDVIGLRAGTLPARELLLDEFGDEGAYREFVESSVEIPSPCKKYLFDER